MNKILTLTLFIFFLTLPVFAEDTLGDYDNLIVDSIYITGDIDSVYEADFLFNNNAVNRSIDDVLRPYQDSGYYYASVVIAQVILQDNKINLQIKLNKGPLVTVEKVIINGIKRSNDKIVRGFIGIGESDTLNSRLLEKADYSIKQIDYLNFAPPVEILPKPGYTKADLVFNFKEMKPVSIMAGGGYLPDKKTMVWDLDLKFNNLFGSGRKVSIKSEKKEQGHNFLELYYRQFIFGKGFNTIEFTASTRDYRDLFYEFNIGGKLETNLLNKLKAGVLLSYRNIEPVKPQIAFSSYSAGFSIRSNNLVEQLNPKHGYNFNWTINYSYRQYRNDTTQSLEGIISSYNETRLNIQLGWYQPVYKSVIGYSAIRYMGYETPEDLPPISELFFIGGPGTLRGFRSEQFLALRSAVLTIEPRYRFRTGHLFLFYDIAYLNNRIKIDSLIKTEENFYQGYGFGIAIRDSYNMLKLSLGWNKDIPYDQPYVSIELSTDI